MARLTFSRTHAGSFDLSEPRLARFNSQLREQVGQTGPLLPETFMRAACTELVRACHEVADRRGVQFYEAAQRVVRERPELFWLTRGLAVNDNDSTADVELT
jgi:hypothetical protein